MIAETMEEVKTRQGFEEAYAQRSNVSIHRLHELGLHAYRCDCGHPDCTGWQMLNKFGDEFNWAQKHIAYQS